LLSGSGSDGTLGLKAIKAASGITFAQEPKSAEWALMPESAISAGAVDFVMLPRAIATELTRMCGRERGGTRKCTSVPDVDADQLDKICGLLLGATGIDFRLYKQATLSRRVAHRMTAHSVGTLPGYVALLQRAPPKRKRWPKTSSSTSPDSFAIRNVSRRFVKRSF
jgi:two-component system CheB/CheR fusion protein